MLPYEVLFIVTRIRFGGYVFLTWAGDHTPRHVHVYRNGSLVAKWDLTSRRVMAGKASKRLRALLEQLEEEGRL